MQSITDVFFDLDHTLWDFEKNSALAFDTVFRQNGIDIEMDAFLEHYVPINLKYWTRYRDGLISQQELRFGRLNEAFAAIDMTFEPEIIEKISEGYIHYLPQFNHLLPGAAEVLCYLHGRYKLHIITNGFAQVQYHKLKNATLLDYFTTITDSESAGVKKPNPAIFEHALRVADATCSASIMIGDCIDADVRGALNCGMHAILYNPVACGDRSVRQIFELTELKSIL